MKHILLLIVLGGLAGCVCLNPNHKGNAPLTVDTGRVIDDLKETKEELIKAGDANTEIGKSVDKALTLAERLDRILEEIDTKQQSKVVIKPE